MIPKIKPVSKNNHYHCSDGRVVSKSYINRMVTKAKRQVLADQIEQIGHNVCTRCFRNDCIPVDCMHLVSVDECQKSGRTEFSWDPENIVPAGRNCHNIYDGRNIGGAQ
jgi:hypothetical protein